MINFLYSHNRKAPTMFAFPRRKKLGVLRANRPHNLERLEDRCCPSDLLIDGTSLTLSGEHTYDAVEIVHGGALYTDFESVLTIRATSIFVDASCAINADGRGFRGAENANGGGPGGGQGGDS